MQYGHLCNMATCTIRPRPTFGFHPVKTPIDSCTSFDGTKPGFMCGKSLSPASGSSSPPRYRFSFSVDNAALASATASPSTLVATCIGCSRNSVPSDTNHPLRSVGTWPGAASPNAKAPSVAIVARTHCSTCRVPASDLWTQPRRRREPGRSASSPR